MKRLKDAITGCWGTAALVFFICIIMAVPLTVYGADKLVVKDAGGTNTVFVVTETGNVGVKVAAPAYAGDFSAGNVAKSLLHFSLAGNDVGGWLTSVSDNNFFVSSGAMWDTAAGGWVQKSADQKAVIAGSGGSGYRIITRQNCAVGTVCQPSTRLTIDFNGKLTLGGGAYSDGATWFDASSRDVKDNIRELTGTEAHDALKDLKPVTFTYKQDAEQGRVGFIAEDVPALVASKDRKGLSAMDIVAVLTKVVKEQDEVITAQKEELRELKKAMAAISSRLADLEIPLKAVASK